MPLAQLADPWQKMPLGGTAGEVRPPPNHRHSRFTSVLLNGRGSGFLIILAHIHHPFHYFSSVFPFSATALFFFYYTLLLDHRRFSVYPINRFVEA